MLDPLAPAVPPRRRPLSPVYKIGAVFVGAVLGLVLLATVFFGLGLDGY
jgi:hypothetical protein